MSVEAAKTEVHAILTAAARLLRADGGERLAAEVEAVALRHACSATAAELREILILSVASALASGDDDAVGWARSVSRRNPALAPVVDAMTESALRYLGRFRH